MPSLHGHPSFSFLGPLLLAAAVRGPPPPPSEDAGQALFPPVLLRIAASRLEIADESPLDRHLGWLMGEAAREQVSRRSSSPPPFPSPLPSAHRAHTHNARYPFGDQADRLQRRALLDAQLHAAAGQSPLDARGGVCTGVATPQPSGTPSFAPASAGGGEGGAPTLTNAQRDLVSRMLDEQNSLLWIKRIGTLRRSASHTPYPLPACAAAVLADDGTGQVLRATPNTIRLSRPCHRTKPLSAVISAAGS